MIRRHFLGALAAARFERPLGLSLYTVRGLLAKDPQGTYKRLAAAGITELEVRPVQLTDHAEFIRAAGMRPVHMFLDSSAVVTGAWAEWHAFMAEMAAKMKLPVPPESSHRVTLDELIVLAKKHGVKRIGVSYLLPGERAGVIGKLNEAAAKCARAGMGFYYHNHAFEFAGAPGERLIDRLFQELHPRVKLEMDLFWAAIGGEDPAALLRKWTGRVASVHLKDVAAGAPRQVSELAMPPASFKEVGAGTLDWKAILAAARAAKVDYYLIEQDSTPGDPVDSVRQSVEYLRGLAV